MLPDRPRKAIAPLKESGERWLEVMELAHRQGVESTATMMMGTGETNAERIEHLRMIRDVQDRTGGFRAFIPWTYQPENNHLKGRTQATTLEYLRLVAVARLFFETVPHLQASWLTTGKDVGQLALHMGVDDLGSIMLEENVISSAGARHRSNLHELIWMIRSADRIPAQRDTLYRPAGGAPDAGRRPDRRAGGLALLLDRPARRRRREAAAAGRGPLTRRHVPRRPTVDRRVTSLRGDRSADRPLMVVRAVVADASSRGRCADLRWPAAMTSRHQSGQSLSRLLDRAGRERAVAGGGGDDRRIANVRARTFPSPHGGLFHDLP